MNALGNEAGFTYDENGRRLSSTDFNGNVTRYEYKEACPCGSPSKVINADNTYETYEYNRFGQVTKKSTHEADGTLAAITQSFYDTSGRLIREIIGGGSDSSHPATDIRKFYDGNLLDWEIIVSPESVNPDGSLKESPANSGSTAQESNYRLPIRSGKSGGSPDQRNGWGRQLPIRRARQSCAVARPDRQHHHMDV